MLIIGLTGPSGAGKGVVCAVLAAYGIPSIDTDRVYHELLVPPSACLDALVDRFGKGILSPDGTLDRRALAAIVFAEGREDDHLALNTITHRYVLDEVRKLCRAYESEGKAAVAVDAPLLFESGYGDECDVTLAVLADRELRRERIMTRDGLSYEAANARLRAQKPDEFYLSRADHAIRNDGDIDLVQRDVEQLLIERGVITP